MNLPKFIFLLVALLAAGVGCTQPKTLAPTTKNPPTDTWQSVDAHAEKLVHRFASSTTDDLILYQLDPDAFSFGFRHSSSPRLISEWSANLPKAQLIINGVYFQEDQSPTGILIANSQRIGARTIDPKRSGLIILSPPPITIRNLSKEPLDLSNLQEAGQSYPFLIEDGQVAIAQDSGLTARRTFFGLDKAGHVYIGVVPSRSISLRQLALELMRLNIAWTNVINLDGGPSSGIITRFSSDQTNIDSLAHIPNVLIIEPR